MTERNEVVFKGPDLNYLRSAAAGLGLEIEEQVDAGRHQSIPSSPLEFLDTEIEESELLIKILDAINSPNEVPAGLGVYLNDRMNSQIPEDVPTIVWRRRRVALRDLTNAVTEIVSESKNWPPPPSTL